MKKSAILAALPIGMALFQAPLRAATVQENWTQNCAACHGNDGAGHTKAGRMVGVKDMTAAAYQAGFTDEQAANQIKNGLKDEAGKEKMKAFSDTFSNDDIKALVAYVRTLRK